MVRFLLCSLGILFLAGQCNMPMKKDLKNGDLLFCGYQSGELSGAIDKVTQTNQSTHFSHIGIIEITEEDTFVIHASSKKGVVKERLTTFLADEKASVSEIYRLADSFQGSITEAIDKANAITGLPYNVAYTMQDSAFYCSQLIYEIFKTFNVFKLEPMTFVDPGTKKFHPDWQKHYGKLGMKIPEGEPGCNPNGLAASKHLIRIGSLD